MIKRQNLVDQFSTFLEFDDVKDSLNKGWYCSPQLHQNMSQRCQKDPTAREAYWAKIILREALKNFHLSREHLAAYLEEVAYWTVHKICKEFAQYQLRYVDCLLIAREGTSQPVKLFNRYDFKQSQVKYFAKYPLRDYILVEIRRGREQEKYSTMGLLRSLSFIGLETALKKCNIDEARIPQYLLLLKCFKEKYIPTKMTGSRKLQPPNHQQLEAIALYYNQSRPPEFNSITGTEVSESLEQCVKWVRTSSKISTISFDNLSPKLKDLKDNREQEEDQLRISKEEVRQEYEEVNQILSRLFGQLPQPTQTLFDLVYGLDINQGDLVNFLEVKEQYQVSRVLRRNKQNLLKSFAQWGEKNWGISHSSQQIANWVKPLDHWLKEKCSLRFQQVLEQTLLTIYATEMTMLQQIYGQQMSVTEVAEINQISASEIDLKLQEIEMTLKTHLVAYIETICSCPLKSMKSADKKISLFVKLYLEQAPYAVFYTNS